MTRSYAAFGSDTGSPDVSVGCRSILALIASRARRGGGGRCPHGTPSVWARCPTLTRGGGGDEVVPSAGRAVRTEFSVEPCRLRHGHHPPQRVRAHASRRGSLRRAED